MQILRDLRYAARQLRRSPGFTITTVLTLALGIGATTAIFSCIYSLLLESLPFAQSSRILTVPETHPQVVGGAEATFPDYQDWSRQQQSFTQLAAYSVTNPASVSMLAYGRSEQVRRVLASGNYFSVLGVTPLQGRLLNEQDDAQGGENHVAVLSAAAWQRYFGGDPHAVGSSIDLNGTPFTIVGVLPSRASFPADGDVWLPMALLDQPTRASRVWHSVNVVGRLRDGVSVPQAKTDMETIAQRLSTAYPTTNRNVGVLLQPLREQMVGTLRPAMLSLFGAVGLLLLVACTNVANLLLARATASERQVAIRQALGAGRMQLFSQFLAQTSMLCVLGGVLGIALAAGALPLLRLALSHTAGVDASMVASIRLSVPVLLFTLGICMVTAILFGMVPAFKTSAQPVDTLRPGSHGSTGRSGRSRALLMAGEIAMAVVVVFLGSLVVRSFQKLMATDPGFRSDHLLGAEVTLPAPQFAEGGVTTVQFYEQVLDKIAQAPGVVSVGTTNVVPMQPSKIMTRFMVEGAPAPAPGAFPLAQLRIVSPEFFHTLGLGLREGRLFERKDIDTGPGGFVVNEAFAKRYLSGRDPVGANVFLGVVSPHPQKIPVLGVVSNARDLGVDSEPQPELYLPGYALHEWLLVRSTVDPQSLASVINHAVQSSNPNQPIYNVQSMDALLADTVARQRMTAMLLSIFAAATLLLAAIGMYGVLSYSVSQRVREIGVRIAVGAQRSDILQLIVRQAAKFTAVGLAAGLVGALFAARLIHGLLYQTGTADPVAVGTAIGALIVVAAAAVIVPALRAASVAPTEALRVE